MPATLPCPKMPKQPANSRCRSPSRSDHWTARNSTVAWATVSRIVSLIEDRPPRGSRGSTAMPSQVCAHPAVARVVADQPGPLVAGAGHHVQVVQVVAGRGHRRAVPAVRHQHDVARCAPPRRRRWAARRCRRPAGSPPGRGAPVAVAPPSDLGLEVVDLLELGLDPVALLVVLVRRVGAPVAGRGEHLAGDDRVRLETSGVRRSCGPGASSCRRRGARPGPRRRRRGGTPVAARRRRAPAPRRSRSGTALRCR